MSRPDFDLRLAHLLLFMKQRYCMVMYGNDKIIKTILETFAWVKERMGGSLDSVGPAVISMLELNGLSGSAQGKNVLTGLHPFYIDHFFNPFLSHVNFSMEKFVK